MYNVCRDHLRAQGERKVMSSRSWRKERTDLSLSFSNVPLEAEIRGWEPYREQMEGAQNPGQQHNGLQ